jgi:glycosyltransferase involved in cell wall biosynthesis
MDNSFRVVALISSYNEENIISQIIGHLVKNGIDVYLIDNQSTDDTVKEATKWLGNGLIRIEEFPNRSVTNPRPNDKYDWTGILRRKEELAREIRANWFIHHDADEIREGPWPGLNLKEAIQWVDTAGYNCIDFKVYNFPPTDDGFKCGDDPYRYFTYYEDCPDYDRIQIKSWKAGTSPVSLINSGGHRVQFEDMRIFPIKFILRHYPIRGQAHGAKKVFEERKKRFLDAERERGWHVQYEQFKDESHHFIKNPRDLIPFDLNKARLDLILSDNIINYLEFREKKANEELYNLQFRVRELEHHSEQLQRHAEQLQRHSEQLQRQHSDELQHLTEEFKRQHSDELQHLTEEFKRQLEELKHHSEELEKQLTLIRDSLSWRITAPLRAVYDWLSRVKENSH